jgi:transcriptional regulator with XRE-family HTH domain
MKSRSQTISKLMTDSDARKSYVRAKLSYLIPAQIRALRLDRPWTQKELGEKSGMLQARISAMERPGEVNFNLETLVRLAAAFRVGLQVRFVPYSEMLRWENVFQQDSFAVASLDTDQGFLNPNIPQEGDESAIRNGTNDVDVLTGATSAQVYEFNQGGNLHVFSNMGGNGRSELWQ